MNCLTRLNLASNSAERNILYRLQHFNFIHECASCQLYSDLKFGTSQLMPALITSLNLDHTSEAVVQ